jgi:hypothetical protein
MAKPWKTDFLSYSVHPTKVIRGRGWWGPNFEVWIWWVLRHHPWKMSNQYIARWNISLKNGFKNVTVLFLRCVWCGSKRRRWTRTDKWHAQFIITRRRFNLSREQMGWRSQREAKYMAWTALNGTWPALDQLEASIILRYDLNKQ